MDSDPDDYHYPEFVEQKPELPRKNYTLFCMHERESFTVTHFWEGKGGELPFFLEVDVGYNPDDEDPFMYPYESGEMLFAFKKDSQKRALLHDSHQRTLSLPMSSDIKFIARKAGEQEVTLSELLKSETLPIQVEWANKELIEFEVDRQTCNHTFFGNILFSGTYEENFFWCLAIDAHGKPNAVPRVLPVNLKDVIFGHIVKVKGVGDSDAKLKEFKDMFVKATESIDYSKDPFFQELAIVDRSTIIFQGQEIEPHIDQNTFVRISKITKPNEEAHSTPLLPPRALNMNSAPTPPPVLPPRPGAFSVEALTINDVAAKLKDLGLKKYRKRFEKERIDGTLLKRLTLSTMQTTFQMTHVEALRLATFISTGHVPK